jgi:hypothetical protein
MQHKYFYRKYLLEWHKNLVDYQAMGLHVREKIYKNNEFNHLKEIFITDLERSEFQESTLQHPYYSNKQKEIYLSSRKILSKKYKPLLVLYQTIQLQYKSMTDWYLLLLVLIFNREFPPEMTRYDRLTLNNKLNGIWSNIISPWNSKWTNTWVLYRPYSPRTLAMYCYNIKQYLLFIITINIRWKNSLMNNKIK